MGTCDICGNSYPDNSLQPFPASLLKDLSRQAFVPEHLPQAMHDMVSADISLESLWKMTVAVNESDWGLCPGCAAEVQEFSASPQKAERSADSLERTTQPDQILSDRVAAFFGGILLGSIVVVLMIYILGSIVAPFTDVLDLGDLYSWSGLQMILLGGLAAGVVVGIVLALTDTSEELGGDSEVVQVTSDAVADETDQIAGVSTDGAGSVADDIREQQNAIADMDQASLRAVLDRTPDYSMKLLAALRLYSDLARDAGIYTWQEQLPYLAQLIRQYRDRKIIFDKAAFVAMFDRLQPYEIAYAVELLPVREVAQTIVEQTINLGFAGPAVRAAFHDEKAAETAFAKTLLPHHPEIYAATFCETFADHIALANRVVREWEPHPEHDWMTLEEVVRSTFAGIALEHYPVAEYISGSNAAIVNDILRAELVAAEQTGNQTDSTEAPEGSAEAVSAQRSHYTYKVPATERGRYLHSLFCGIRAGSGTTPFTYDDLPAAPADSGADLLFDFDPSIEVVTIGSDADRAKSPFLEELQRMGLIKAVAPMTFVLTDTGYASSLVVEGTDTSGFLVFDYNVMDISYGHQAFTCIQAALEGSGSRCAFYDGDVSSAVLVDVAEHAEGVVAVPGKESPLSGDSSTPIGAYLAALWTDDAGTFDVLHVHLSKFLPKAYVGYLTLGATHNRDDFLNAISNQLMLTPAIEFLAGAIVPGTGKYGL